MRNVIVTMTLGLAAGAPFAVAAAAEPPEAASACADCHNSPISLAGTGAAELEKKMTEMRDEGVPHPVMLTGLSDEEISAIAEYLNES